MFSGSAAPAAMSQTLMDLVQLTQYDTLKAAEKGSEARWGELKEEILKAKLKANANFGKKS